MARASVVRLTGLLAGLVLAAVLGCKSTGSKGVEETPRPTGSEFDQGAVPSPGGAGATRPELVTVYFDYDQSEIRPDARAALKEDAQAIMANPGWGVVTIEGHCDERGSEEYNLALGERRANAVKRYLADLGVPSSRMRTVSFGEARPAVPGHDESAWRYNRRVEFKASS